ncbi:MAG: GTP cyclohydrolase FolE2 [bacterium]
MSQTKKSYELTDTQGQDDNRLIAINKVGIRDFKLPMVVDERKSGTQDVTATVDIGVDLIKEQRGAHMSRFIELIEQYRQESFNVHSIPDLLEDTCERLGSNNAYVTLDFDYFMEKSSPLSDKTGILDFKCGFGGARRDGETVNWIKAEVPVTTLCPCSKKNSDRGAHNQRALVKSKIVINDMVWLEELIEMIEEEGSSQLYALLKREDEAYVTDEAYDNPKFVEDVVRDLSHKVQDDDRMEDFFIECISFESIHNHDAYARVYQGSIWQENFFG